MTTPAARALASARRNGGLSQEELAARSGLSERTIRTLESGNAKRPHRDTLVAIAGALQMAESNVEAFVASWRTPFRSMEELLGDVDPASAVQQAIADELKTIRDRASDYIVRIGSDRRWQTVTEQHRFEVIAGEIDRYTVVAGFDSDVMDPRKVELVDWVNIEPGPVVDLPGPGVRAFVGLLRHTLRVGDIYAFELTADYGSAYRPDARRSAEENDMRMAISRSLDRLTFEIRFAADAVPRRVWGFRQDSVNGDAYSETDLVVSPFGICHLYLEPAAAGVHGVRWEWD